MVKMEVSEVRTQTADIKAYCQSLKDGANQLNIVAQGLTLEVGISGTAGDSIKGYLSTMYPSLAKTMTLHAESLEEANQAYLDGYTETCGGKSLDSEVLEAQIKGYNTSIDRLATSKENQITFYTGLPFAMQQLVRDDYKTAIDGLASSIATNETERAKIQEKLEKLLEFDAKSSSYFSGVSESANLMNEGLQALGGDPATGTLGAGNWNGNGFNRPLGDWQKRANENWSNREFIREYEIDRPKDMSEKDFKTYIETLRNQERELKTEGWDGSSLKAYFDYVNKNVKNVSTDKVLATLDDIYLDVHEVGSDIYTVMFDAYGKVDGKIPKGKEVEVNQKKLEMMLEQMGGYIDEHGMLQLNGGKYAFDSDMPPHGNFLKLLSNTVQRAFPDKNLKEYGELGQKMSHFRIYLDKHNIDYLKNRYPNEKNDYERLKKYAEEFDVPLDYSTGASLHNRSLDGEFTYGKNMKVLAPKNYDKNAKYPGARMSEFIIDIETGNFVSQWNVYTDPNSDGVYDFDPKNYNAQDCADLANTESFNYGPSKGTNEDRPKGDNNSHTRLDKERPDDTPVRENILKDWPSQKESKDGGQYADIVKVGEADVEAWNKVPKNEREKVYKNFADYCRDRGESGNPGFSGYCQEKGIYGY